jgi:alanine racemase
VLRSGKNQNSRFRRDAWLEVNLSNLEFNIKALYEEFQKPLIPVLKADAYGHGANVLAELLDSYDFIHCYAVASIDEALVLRETTKKSIMVLGITPEWALETAIANNIEITVADYQTAFEANKIAETLSLQAKIHLKIDTGMNRIGFKNPLVEIKQIEAFTNLQIKTIYTHIASPLDSDFKKEQLNNFYDLVSNFDYEIHPGSSVALRSELDRDFDFVRLGIELYGLNNKDLKPLLSLYSRVSFVKHIKKGESVSYGRTWFAQEDTKIITLPLGYADGVHRLMSNKINACYKDSLIKQVGTITMDQMMFDAKDLEINTGDLVELFGEKISIDVWAEAAQTINYEIATSLNLRLPKTYTR